MRSWDAIRHQLTDFFVDHFLLPVKYCTMQRKSRENQTMVIIWHYCNHITHDIVTTLFLRYVLLMHFSDCKIPKIPSDFTFFLLLVHILLGWNVGYVWLNRLYCALCRYSLNGQVKAMPVPYIPSDTRVLSTASSSNQILDIGRPDSRYSNRSRDRRSRSRSRHRSRSKHRRANVQSSSSGQSGSTQFSSSNSTGRLVTNGNPRLL